MSITSESITGKRFATVRKDGYDTGEVDECLADLEHSLVEATRKHSVLEEANGLLRDQLHRAEEGLRQADEERQRLRDERAGAEDPVRTSSQAAARLLEIATRDAEELVATARAQADELIVGARAEAETMVAMAQEEAARQRAEADRSVAEVEKRVAELSAFEESYREALANLLASHVEALEGPSLGRALAADAD